MKKRSLIAVMLIFVMLLSSCSAPGVYNGDIYPFFPAPGGNMDLNGADGELDAPAEAVPDADIEAEAGVEGGADEVHTVKENPYIRTEDENVSTFAADVDTASYAYFRKLVSQGYSIEELKAMGPFRSEEMVNYFNYSYPDPESGKLFSVNAEIAPCPWNPEAQLLMLGLQAKKTVAAEKNNLVFLIDISGSMFSSDKLELLQKAFGHLTENLGSDDTVSIVTYAGEVQTVLDGCEGSKKDKIKNAVDSLTAGGSTAGQSGIEMAYRVAEAHFIPDGNNRIILASDGDFNVGMSSVTELEELITAKRKTANIFLSVLGFGTGNYRDNIMETLANKGNGVYYYIDGEREAEKVLGTDIISTLYTVAKDVKLQLTFNKDIIDEYRLVGYENRMLQNEDFLDDTKDAGEMGAGHSVTVLYEIKLKDGIQPEGEMMTLGVRYKEPDGEKSVGEEYTVTASSMTDTPSDRFKLATSAAMVSMYLNSGKYISNDVTVGYVLDILKSTALDDEYKEEFKALVEKLK